MYGFDATASSGVPAFVIRSGTAEKIRLVDGKVGIGTDAPDFLLDVVGDIGMSGKLYHNGDHNTYIGFTGDTQTFRTGGADRVTINNNGVGIDTTNRQVQLILYMLMVVLISLIPYMHKVLVALVRVMLTYLPIQRVITRLTEGCARYRHNTTVLYWW